jgi:hypothetical protein
MTSPEVRAASSGLSVEPAEEAADRAVKQRPNDWDPGTRQTALRYAVDEQLVVERRQRRHRQNLAVAQPSRPRRRPRPLLAGPPCVCRYANPILKRLNDDWKASLIVVAH